MRRALVGVGRILQLQPLVAFFFFFDVKFVFESSLHALDLVLKDRGDGDADSKRNDREEAAMMAQP